MVNVLDEVLLLLGGVALPVDDAHLLDKSTLAAFSRPQQEQLQLSAGLALLSRNDSVNRIVNGASVLLFLREATVPRVKQGHNSIQRITLCFNWFI